jgi:hypothetical protein
MAEHGSRTVSENRAHRVRVRRCDGSDEIHAAIQPAQLPISQPIVDRIRAEADLEKLLPSNNAVLPAGKLRDRPFPNFSEFAAHGTENPESIRAAPS